jgi:nucleoside-diphosphate-sugar epimerase
MKVLVTGGGGFLGRYIVKRLLARGDAVTILGRSDQPDLAQQGVKVVRGDISNRDLVVGSCQGQDVVYHVAALAGIWGRRETFFRTNVLGSRHVLEGCRRHGVGKLIYTSTPSVVFTGEPLRGVDESQPYGSNWLCHYAETKALAEAEVLAANGPGLRTVALRPHLIWGVGDNHLIPRVVARARSGRLRIVGDGTNQVDIVHVENAAEAHLLAEKALDQAGRADGKAYFISQGKPVVLWDWINDLLRRLDQPPLKKRISLAAAYRLGAVLEGVFTLLRLSREPPMTRFLAVELAKDHYFNIAAARRDLGYVPKDMEEGLAELAEGLRASVNL